MAIVFILAAGGYGLFANLLRAGTASRAVAVAAIKDMMFGHYHLWFLLMLIGFYIAVPLLRKLTADKKTTQYFLLLWVVLTILQNAAMLLPPVANFVEIQAGKLSLSVAAGFAGYFVLGHYLYQYPPTKTVRKVIYAGGLVALAVTVLFTTMGGLNGHKWEALYGYLLPNTLLETAALFLFVREKLENATLSEKTVKVIGFLSSVSFGEYLTHDLFNLVLHKIGVTALSASALLTVPLLTLLVSGCAIGLTVLLKKIPKLGDYLL
jgi:surface polysaccharide O-acyltransferase-like enzyme